MDLTGPQLVLLRRMHHAHPAAERISGPEERSAAVLLRLGLVTHVRGDLWGVTDAGRERSDALGLTYMRSSFRGRALPEAIWIGDECIAGPFCVHCGNPFSMHGFDLHCPDRVLHPVFPPPACGWHGLTGVAS